MRTDKIKVKKIGVWEIKYYIDFPSLNEFKFKVLPHFSFEIYKSQLFVRTAESYKFCIEIWYSFFIFYGNFFIKKFLPL